MELNVALDQLAVEEDAPLDLAELAFSLARDEYLDLDVDAYLSELNGMAHEAAAYLRGSLDAQVHGLCRYLFHEMGFRGNLQDYYDPRNSYLNEVMDRRTGIPLTLSVVAMAIGQRAGLAIVGVGLPGHFIAKAVADGKEVLFDPFHGGRQLTPVDCQNLVQQSTGTQFDLLPEHLTATTLKALIVRMMSNLKTVYLSQPDFERAARVIEHLRRLSPDDLLQRRDLGVSLARAGRPGRAIDHLAAYLKAAPDGPDTPAVRKLLGQVRAEIGKWN
jgi:regulator of sirC expression with transglutaminase-like and TPR domain